MKKVLRYDNATYPPQVGSTAIIHLLEDHPNCQTRDIHTSKVVRVEENGDFETLNTVYKKETK